MRMWRRMVALGLAVASLVVTSPILALGRTITIPATTSGRIISDQLDTPKALTPSDIATITNWLERHRFGWQMNVVTPPAPTTSISLDTVGEKAALALSLWQGPKYPGWQTTVTVESPAGNPIGIQKFSPEELAPLLGIGRP